MADETTPTEKVKKTPEEKAARREAREKKLANMSPRQLEKRNAAREKRKAERQKAQAPAAKTSDAE